jgi:hypothetical protein
MNRRDFFKTVGALSLTTPFSEALSSAAGSPALGQAGLALPLETGLMGTSPDAPPIRFQRASPASARDYRQILFFARPGEARFHGARRVENLVAASEDFTAYAGSDRWQITGNVSDPLGGRRASTVTARAGDATLLTTSPAEPGHAYVNSIYLRRRSGRDPVWLRDAADRRWWRVRPGSSWQRFSTEPTDCRSVCIVGLKLTAAGDAIDVAFAQIEDVTGQEPGDRRIGEYVSVGVLPPPYHGAFVDGVKYFSYENGNTVNAGTRVVTESRGDKIPDALMKGVLIEGPRTNLCENFNLRPISLSGVSASGGDLRLTNDTGRLFAPAHFNADILTPYPELKRLASGRVYRFENNTHATHIVRIAGACGSGRYSGFVYARSTKPTARLAIANKASVPIDTTGLYGGNDVYAKFEIQNVAAAAGDQLQLIVPSDVVVHFIGNQLEEGAFCSSLIEVQGAPARRDGDFLHYATGARLPATAGTMLLSWTPFHSSAEAPDGERVLLDVSPQQGGALIARGEAILAATDRDEAAPLRSKQVGAREAMMHIALAWTAGEARRMFINGRLAGTESLDAPWKWSGNLAIGSRNGTGHAFGCFKNLYWYSKPTPAARMIEQMTVRRARLLFGGGQQVQDFYLSRANCHRYVERLAEAGFNVILPYVWGGNGTRYLNRLGLPIDYTVAKYYEQGFDGLACLIDACHAKGIEVHPVFMVVFRGWSRDMKRFDKFFDNPRPPPVEQGRFYNIHMQEFRDWIVEIMTDFARTYDIDGLCFDHLRSGLGTRFYASNANIAAYRRRYGRDLRADIRRGINAPGVKLREWNRTDIEDILFRTVAAVRAHKRGIVISNAGLGQCLPIRASDVIRDEGQYNVDWVNSGKVDYIIPWYYGHPFVESDWSYKQALRNRRRGTVMGGLYHGPRPAEPAMLHSIMPRILADDGDMAALYPYGMMSAAHIEILKNHYFQLPARIPWR